MQQRAVVLLSGGLDSATCLAWAIREGFLVHALTFHYDQNHSVEVEHAQRIARMAEVEHLVIELDFPFDSALTRGGVDTPEIRKSGVEEGIPATYVPARNTIFLSYALAWAETLNAGAICIGVNVIDYSGYPDCRPEYIAAFQNLAKFATKDAVARGCGPTILTPLINMTKAQIIELGVELGVEYELTISCYDPVSRPGVRWERRTSSPCGECDSCRLRAKGFAEVGIPDPALS